MIYTLKNTKLTEKDITISRDQVTEFEVLDLFIKLGYQNLKLDMGNGGQARILGLLDKRGEYAEFSFHITTHYCKYPSLAFRLCIWPSPDIRNENWALQTKAHKQIALRKLRKIIEANCLSPQDMFIKDIIE